ncbi:hypothetical protein AGMMS49574_19550 [Bacteroidia bacterium]|nr:hypothetical protein AGMMS49574_19550 [Bacteroidia bacterium]
MFNFIFLDKFKNNVIKDMLRANALYGTVIILVAPSESPIIGINRVATKGYPIMIRIKFRFEKKQLYF